MPLSPLKQEFELRCCLSLFAKVRSVALGKVDSSSSRDNNPSGFCIKNIRQKAHICYYIWFQIKFARYTMQGRLRHFFLNEHVETLSFIKFSNDNRKYVYEIMKRIRKKSTNTMDCLNFIELFRIHGILNQSLP